MVRIVAWKCRSSGTLFEDKKSFQKHLCTRAFRQHVARKNEARRRRLKDAVFTMREMTSFAELEDWLNANGDALYALAREGNTRIPLKGKKKHRLWDVELSDMSFRMIATTHAAPIGRKNTGWGKTAAERHPAWYGRIKYRQENFESFSSDIFRGTPINTGSGGGGDVVSYDVTLFLEDFPFMAEMMRQEGRLEPSIPYPLQVPPSPVLADA